MGCTYSQHARFCENPAHGFNSKGVMEVFGLEGEFTASSRPNRTWKAKAEAAETERYPFVFPALTQKITSVQMSLKFSGVGFSAGEVPTLYLEKLNSGGVPTTIEMLTAATPVHQMYQFNLDSAFPVVQATERGNILRLKVVIPAGPSSAVVAMSDITVAIPSGSGGIPAVRLPFEESQKRNGDKQSLEMRSYRSWTIRPGTRGWTNTAQLSVKPTAIVVDMQVESRPCVAAASGPPLGRPPVRGKGNPNAIYLQLVRHGKTVPVSVMIFGSGFSPATGTKTNVHFEIDLIKGLGGVDASAKKLISSFHPSDYYQVETQQLHPDITMKISHFMMKITCDDTKGGNLANTLIHQSKLMTLAGSHSAADEDISENAFREGERKTNQKAHNSSEDRGGGEDAMIGGYCAGGYYNDYGDTGGGGDNGDFFDGGGDNGDGGGGSGGGYDGGDNGFGGGDGGGGGGDWGGGGGGEEFCFLLLIFNYSFHFIFVRLWRWR
jgi:hypothetical protein